METWGVAERGGHEARGGAERGGHEARGGEGRCSAETRDAGRGNAAHGNGARHHGAPHPFRIIFVSPPAAPARSSAGTRRTRTAARASRRRQIGRAHV